MSHEATSWAWSVFADHRLGGAFEVGKFLSEFVAEHDPKVAGAMLDKLVADPEPKVGAPVGNQNASKGENKWPDSANCLSPQLEQAAANGIGKTAQKTLDKIAKVAPGYLPKIAAKEISINRAAVELGIVKVKSPLEQAIAAFQRLSEEDAYMQLVLCNTQSELHPLEEGIHALNSGLNGSEYARKIGKPQPSIAFKIQAARVLDSISREIDERIHKDWRNLAEIHAAPKW